MNKETQYSVWVGGAEVNSYYLSLQEAKNLAEEYEKNNYTDVFLELIKSSGKEIVPEKMRWLTTKGESL